VHTSPQKYAEAGAAWQRPLVAVISGVCAVLGMAVLIGWQVHSIALIQLAPTLAPMQFNTALCFVLAGLALGGWDRVPRVTPILGGLVAAIGGLTLSEYLFHTNLGIDQLLFRSYINTETSNIGRMSPVSSFCFALSGIALILLGLRAAPRWRFLAVGSLSSVVVSITIVALLGYAFRLPGTYGWGQLTRIAIHTATGLCLVGTGLFIIAWSAALYPGERAPRWLPAALGLAVFTGSLVLFFALEGKQDQEIAQTVRAGVEGAKNQITVRMESRSRSLARMAQDWEFSGAPAQAAWEANAASYVHDLPDVQALEWIDATHHVRWIVPVAGNEGKLNESTLEERRQAALEQAEREHRPVVTRTVSLADGGLGFVVYAPIIVNGRSDGFLAAVSKAQTCLDRYLPPAVADGESITVSEGGKTFYTRDAGAPAIREDWTVQEKIDLHGATWNLRMWPTPDLAARLNSPLPAVVLCAGTLGALLLGAVSFYAQRSSRQATETTRANAALQDALDKVKTLEGLLPICSYCKRVRDDTGYWSQIDTYLRKHTKASLSHGYCPECAAKFYEECGLDVPDKVKAELAAGNFE
jgi:sensor domain CHASE-containing protein